MFWEFMRGVKLDNGNNDNCSKNSKKRNLSKIFSIIIEIFATGLIDFGIANLIAAGVIFGIVMMRSYGFVLLVLFILVQIPYFVKKHK